MKRAVRKILKFITTLIIAVLALFALVTVCIRMFGIQVYVVLSGSMEPDYPTGSLIYVKPTEPSMLEIGDVITFRLSNSTTATHRIIEVINNEENTDDVCFRTKGDANDIPDTMPIESENIIGTPIFTIPYLGYAAKYLQTTSGKYLMVAVGSAILLLIAVVELTGMNKKHFDNR